MNITAIAITAIICTTLCIITAINKAGEKKRPEQKGERQLEIPGFIRQAEIPEDQARQLRAIAKGRSGEA